MATLHVAGICASVFAKRGVALLIVGHANDICRVRLFNGLYVALPFLTIDMGVGKARTL